MTRSAILRRAGDGFSLVELSIVTLIIGIFLTLGLSAMNAVRENTALSATNAKQAAIKEALIGYLRRNSRLPCPNSVYAPATPPNGSEDRNPAGVTNPCTSNFGIIPYVTLGIARDAALDGWGNFFSYHVSDTLGSNLDWVRTANFRTGNTGILTVNDRNGAATPAIATNIVAVIVSHGPNGFGARTIGGTTPAPPTGADEIENTNSVANTTYFRRSPTTDDNANGGNGGAFDDIVLFITADDLLNPLLKDGSFKSPTSDVSDAFYKIKTALIAYALGNPSANGNAACNAAGATSKCRFFPNADTSNGLQEAGNYDLLLPYIDLALNQTDAIDPWGKRYRYQICRNLSDTSVGTHGISSALPTACLAGTAYPTGLRIISEGPDRTNGTADDIAISVSIGELRGALGSALP